MLHELQEQRASQLPAEIMDQMVFGQTMLGPAADRDRWTKVSNLHGYYALLVLSTVPLNPVILVRILLLWVYWFGKREVTSLSYRPCLLKGHHRNPVILVKHMGFISN